VRLRDRLTALAGAARHRRGLVAVAALVVVLSPPVAFGVWTWRTAAGVDLSRPEEAALIYAAGQVLAPGVSVEAADLSGTLRRLGYRETQSTPAAAGQFRRAAALWELHLRPRDDPRSTRPALPVRVLVDGGRIRQLITVAGEPLEELELEPETLTGLGGAANQLRHPVPLAAVPKHLVQAVLAAEDQRFFEHRGVDARAVARAIWVNVRRGELHQGGSTLTQQLVKNLVLTPKRTWGRKVREATIALALERRYTKEEILSAYLNGIYLGQHGGFALYGVGAAARSFFGKDVERITLGEAATLAGHVFPGPAPRARPRAAQPGPPPDARPADARRQEARPDDPGAPGRPAGNRDRRPRAVLRGLGAGAGRAGAAGR
jgi:transglycosylase-like protein/bifunctional transglycosylase-like protein